MKSWPEINEFVMSKRPQRPPYQDSRNPGKWICPECANWLTDWPTPLPADDVQVRSAIERHRVKPARGLDFNGTNGMCFSYWKLMISLSRVIGIKLNPGLFVAGREDIEYAKSLKLQWLQEYLPNDKNSGSSSPVESAGAAAPPQVPRPVGGGIKIPEIARGYEDIYRRFLMGKLIYKPDPKSDKGRIELPIRVLNDPLDGVFDLSRCGDSWKYISISTGYRIGRRAGNDNKVEVWLAPRFLIERNIAGSSSHFRPIMTNWDQTRVPVGIFWTWGEWDNMGWYDYLTTKSFDEISDNNLYAKWEANMRPGPHRHHFGGVRPQEISKFHVSFVN